MDYSYRNLIVDSIFSEEDIAKIYGHVNNTSESKKQLEENLGHVAYFSWLPEDIVTKIVSVAQSVSDKRLELRELSFARYEASLTPRLHPHLDTVFKEPRLTFDIQVGGNVSWDLIVEGRSYTLKNNQALTFSGTHQIHWRPKRIFEDGEYLDMIFCHFSEVGATPNTLGDEHYLPLQARCDKLLAIYDES